MKITIQDDERRAEVETNAVSIDEVMDELCNLLLAWGFHPDSVKQGIFGKAEDYETEKETSLD